jgi:hypothetical protein
MRKRFVVSMATFAIATVIPAGSSLLAQPAGIARSIATAQDQSRPDNEAQAKTFTGKITKANGKYVLQEMSGGNSYQLDDQNNAKKYSGKSVLVTGTLDASTNTIRVQKIEASA